MSDQEEDFAAMFEASVKAARQFSRGQTIQGTIVGFGPKVAFVDVGGKGEAEIDIAELKDGAIREYILNPQDLGFSLATREDLQGGDIARNAEVLREVLNGVKGPKRDIVLLNAGAALYVAGLAGSIKDGAALAARAIDTGKAAATLQAWAAVTQG